jgi:ribose transport system permease protein
MKSLKSIIGPLAAAILVAFIVGLTTDRFWHAGNWSNIALSVSITALMAIGASLVIFVGCIDISSGSMIALLSMISASLIKFNGWPLGLGIAATVLLGGVLGAINGALIAYLRVPSFVATLATMSIYKGMAFLFNNGSPIFSVHESFDRIFYGHLWGFLPLPFLYIVVFYALFAYILKYNRYGRELYAVGGNDKAASLSGIRIRTVRFTAFAIAGIMTGFAAVLMSSRLNSGSPNYGAGMEMSSIGAAVVGGASLAGGNGYIINTLIGALTIVIVQNGLNLNAVPTSMQNITLGVIILIAVLMDTWKEQAGIAIKRLFAMVFPSVSKPVDPSGLKK